MPAVIARRWRPAVPDETAAAYGAPTRSASISSKRSIVGPSEILRDLDHAVARDADEDRGGEIGRVDDAVAHDEEALARAVRDVPVGGEHDRLVVAGAVRLADGEHRVDVDAGRLRRVRDDVRA